MDKPIEKHYTNGEITVVWKNHICIHSAICRNGMIEVFNPKERPWINMENGTTDAIIAQVDKCPSGAISWFRNSQGNSNNIKDEMTTKVEVVPNGPLRVYGSVEVHKSDGTIERRDKLTSFCRCGQSANKPFCDGTHKRIEWKETPVAT